jgi:hypothetical protein
MLRHMTKRPFFGQNGLLSEDNKDCDEAKVLSTISSRANLAIT